MWQSAPPMPSALDDPKITNIDTNVYLMGHRNQVLYLFDVIKKAWRQKAEIPQNPGRGFNIASGNGKLFATGVEMDSCWQYNISTDTWAKLASPALRHYCGALIYHNNSLLLLGGHTEKVEGYAAEADKWVVAPFKLPMELFYHYAFMMDLGE